MLFCGSSHCILITASIFDGDMLLFLGFHPSNMQMYLRDESAQTVVHAATLRYKLQISTERKGDFVTYTFDSGLRLDAYKLIIFKCMVTEISKSTLDISLNKFDLHSIS